MKLLPADNVRESTSRATPYIERPAATPFVKWPGGKRTLIPAIAVHFPERVDNYWEPFVGGGAVFFTFANRIERAILSDTNEDLMTTYQVVKTNVDALIARLREHESAHRRREGKKFADGKTYYYRVREEEPDDPVEVAARFIYLNRTCYNGLYRVNKAGRFNVPEGTYKNPDICNADRLRRASKALANAQILSGGFDRIVQPSAGDFIYCDPPYHGCFTGYQAAGFPEDAQKRLRDAADAWVSEGASVLLSNADTPAMRSLYGHYPIEEAQAPRYINANGAGRGKAAELLIRAQPDA